MRTWCWPLSIWLMTCLSDHGCSTVLALISWEPLPLPLPWSSLVLGPVWALDAAPPVGSADVLHDEGCAAEAEALPAGPEDVFLGRLADLEDLVDRHGLPFHHWLQLMHCLAPPGFLLPHVTQTHLPQLWFMAEWCWRRRVLAALRRTRVRAQERRVLSLLCQAFSGARRVVALLVVPNEMLEEDVQHRQWRRAALTERERAHVRLDRRLQRA